MALAPTVFIVDDDPAARHSVAALVQSKGMPVETCGSAVEFLNRFDPAQPGCLITDIRMPGMTGLELQEALRTRGSRLPVILITGFGDVPSAVRAMKAGAFTFLEKPCRDHELWSSVRKALQAAEQFAADQARQAEIQRRMSHLTVEELQVLHALVSGKSNKLIAQELDLGLRTIELRRANVLKKMHVQSLAELVRQVLIAEGIPFPRQGMIEA